MRDSFRLLCFLLLWKPTSTIWHCNVGYMEYFSLKNIVHAPVKWVLNQQRTSNNTVHSFVSELQTILYRKAPKYKEYSQEDKIKKYDTITSITQTHDLSNCGLKAVLGFDHDNWKKGVKGGKGCCSVKQQTLIASIWFSKSMWPKSINNHAAIFWNNFITCFELTTGNWGKVFSYFLLLDCIFAKFLSNKEVDLHLYCCMNISKQVLRKVTRFLLHIFSSIDRWQIALLTPCALPSLRASTLICSRQERLTRLQKNR